MCGFLVCSRNGLGEKEFKSYLEKIEYRGPDQNKMEKSMGGNLFGFNRLAINGATKEGMQPFKLGKNLVVANAEIFNFLDLKKKYLRKYNFKSNSDCEVILPLYEIFGIDLFKMLDAEFAIVIEYDGKLIAARDPYGVRGMFYGYDKAGKIAFASEAKALKEICGNRIYPFPPGYVYRNGKFTSYINRFESKNKEKNIDSVLENILTFFNEAVEKRLLADKNIGFGFLLSGGLDSSLIAGAAVKLLRDKGYKGEIFSFCIGMQEDSIDTHYAKLVADYIGTTHINFYMSKDEVKKSLEEVIYHIESYDTTTVRASVGMYMCCKKIKEVFPEIKVLLTGEGSDEIFGYRYTDKAPNQLEFQNEAEKRLREIHMYDALRADRCISAFGLEGRAPFLDKTFADYCMNIIPSSYKMNYFQKGKLLLRLAFRNQNIIPDEILLRNKEAFSDAVGFSLVDILKEYAEECYSDEEFELKRQFFKHMQPKSKEDLLYREIFKKHFSDNEDLIPDYWMPNPNWEDCNVTDPSARVLSCYEENTQKDLNQLYDLMINKFN